MIRARQNEHSSSLERIDLSQNLVHYASVPVRKTANSSHENWAQGEAIQRERTGIERDKANLANLIERLQGSVNQLQSELAIQRGRLAFDKTRNAREIINNQKNQAALSVEARKNYSDTIANRRLCPEDRRISVALNSQSGSAKNLHWTVQQQQPVASPALAASSQWKRFSSEETLPCRKKVYINCDGTKVEEKDCGCTLYEYPNGDAFWKSSVEDIEIDCKNGVNEVRFKKGLMIRLFNTGQLDLIQCDGQTTSILPNGTRFEKKLDVYRRWITQKFTPEMDPLRTEIGVTLKYAEGDVWIAEDGDVRITTPTLEIHFSASDHAGRIRHIGEENVSFVLFWEICCYLGRQKPQEGRNRAFRNTFCSSDLDSLWDQ